MTYKRIFNPKPLFQDFRETSQVNAPGAGDRRDGRVYSYTEPLVLAINVALATGRPLLLRGKAGCGKSSVVYNVARVMKWRYYEKVITTRTSATDLLWRFDAVRRLGDAQVASRGSTDGSDEDNDAVPKAWRSQYPYIEPEVLWWVFDAESAERRGLSNERQLFFEKAEDPAIYRPPGSNADTRSVVLLDEIDKAEPDVPNNLLVALGSLQFPVDEIARVIKLRSARDGQVAPDDLPLLIITTNEERQLPPAFLRRCVVYRFPRPDRTRFLEIAKATEGRSDEPLYEKVAHALERLAERRGAETREKIVPSLAEFIDSVRACKTLMGDLDDQALLDEILERVTWKNPHPGE